MPKGMTPYEELENTIKSGGSIVYKGTVIADLNSLPTKLQYAEGDEEESAAVLTQMKAEQQEKQAAIAKAEAAQKKPAPGDEKKEDTEKK